MDLPLMQRERMRRIHRMAPCIRSRIFVVCSAKQAFHRIPMAAAGAFR
jgi:hypothetical protein